MDKKAGKGKRGVRDREKSIGVRDLHQPNSLSSTLNSLQGGPVGVVEGGDQPVGTFVKKKGILVQPGHLR